MRTRLAVLGSPIGHSLSPTLHAAAYGVLGLPWSYDAVDVSGERLPEFLTECDDQWRGLSLTMPLKRDVIPLLDETDHLVDLTGVANTLLFDAGVRRGFNTDVAGITGAFIQNGVTRLRDVVILGGGATAASALVAASELGAVFAHLWVRTPAKATAIGRLGSRLGVEVRLSSFTDANSGDGHPDAVISTLPNGSGVDLVLAESLRSHSVLLDVAYDPWPTPLAVSWLEVGGRVISGLQMLVTQALFQVRIFVSGDPGRELPDESEVVEAMWASVGGSGLRPAGTT